MLTLKMFTNIPEKNVKKFLLISTLKLIMKYKRRTNLVL